MTNPPNAIEPSGSFLDSNLQKVQPNQTKIRRIGRSDNFACKNCIKLEVIDSLWRRLQRLKVRKY